MIRDVKAKSYATGNQQRTTVGLGSASLLMPRRDLFVAVKSLVSALKSSGENASQPFSLNYFGFFECVS
jgi:hypothetical protein